MSDHKAGLLALVRVRLSVAARAMLLIATISDRAWSQAPVTPPGSFQSVPAEPSGTKAVPDQTSPLVTPKPENPGLFNEIGKLFNNPPSMFPSFTSRSPQQSIDDFNARAKEAGDSLSQLAKPVVVRGRIVCPVAGNGAPDCKAASDKLCQAKGFKEGKSLDTDQAQSCSAAALLSGGNRLPGNCRTDNYVTRALCQ
jgi:hypothetical protein